MSLVRELKKSIISLLAAADLVSPAFSEDSALAKGSSIEALLSNTNPICAPSPIFSTVL